jgi:hypothetical protein
MPITYSQLKLLQFDSHESKQNLFKSGQLRMLSSTHKNISIYHFRPKLHSETKENVAII